MSTTSRHPTAQRFRDPRQNVYDFLSEISVVCPRCRRAAHVRPAADPEPGHRSIFAPRRLTCLHCGSSAEHASRSLQLPHGAEGAVADPYFGLPLLLQTRTRHGCLWAYNPQHLTLIHDYVAASLRERIPWNSAERRMTLVARLPAWVKHAKNRDEMLRAIARIRASLMAG